MQKIKNLLPCQNRMGDLLMQNILFNGRFFLLQCNHSLFGGGGNDALLDCSHKIVQLLIDFCKLLLQETQCIIVRFL